MARIMQEDDAEKLYERRKALGITRVFKMVDTCSAEFEAKTPYFYSTFEARKEGAGSGSLVGAGTGTAGRGAGCAAGRGAVPGGAVFSWGFTVVRVVSVWARAAGASSKPAPLRVRSSRRRFISGKNVITTRVDTCVGAWS